MMTCIQREHSALIQRMRDDYLRTLVAPMDGMWESAVIARATFWELRDRERHAGYLCIGSDHTLLRFHLAGEYRARAQEIFRWIIATHGIRRAITSTIEPLYFSLCLDVQQGILLHSYLFHGSTHVEAPSRLGAIIVRTVEKGEFDAIARFYRAQTRGAGEWIEAFLRARLDRQELVGLYDGQSVVATGECIPSRAQPPYADVGMVVAHAYRGRGLGSAMLVHLKEHCSAAGWVPICSCAADNGASKRAIEKAGFLSEHRMVEVVVHERDAAGPPSAWLQPP